MPQPTPTRRRAHLIGWWRRLPRWVRVPVRLALTVVVAALVLADIPYSWTQFSSAGHIHGESSAPSADVVIVLGGEVEPDRTQPRPFLKGRLDTAAALVTGGQATVVLVSGDANGGSGNETAVMTDYLARHGVDPARVVPDPYGLDTYDSCVRARRVFGVERALVVTQRYHLSRAVALCRQAGIDADGVVARCDGCGINLVRNGARDYLACTKAALDALTDRDPAVVSTPSPAVAQALARARAA